MTDGLKPKVDPNDVKSAIKGWVLIAVLTIGVLGAGVIYLEM